MRIQTGPAKKKKKNRRKPKAFTVNCPGTGTDTDTDTDTNKPHQSLEVAINEAESVIGTFMERLKIGGLTQQEGCPKQGVSPPLHLHQKSHTPAASSEDQRDKLIELWVRRLNKCELQKHNNWCADTVDKDCNTKLYHPDFEASTSDGTQIINCLTSYLIMEETHQDLIKTTITRHLEKFNDNPTLQASEIAALKSTVKKYIGDRARTHVEKTQQTRTEHQGEENHPDEAAAESAMLSPCEEGIPRKKSSPHSTDEIEKLITLLEHYSLNSYTQEAIRSADEKFDESTKRVSDEQSITQHITDICESLSSHIPNTEQGFDEINGELTRISQLPHAHAASTFSAYRNKIREYMAQRHHTTKQENDTIIAEITQQLDTLDIARAALPDTYDIERQRVIFNLTAQRGAEQSAGSLTDDIIMFVSSIFKFDQTKLKCMHAYLNKARIDHYPNRDYVFLKNQIYNYSIQRLCLQKEKRATEEAAAATEKHQESEKRKALELNEKQKKSNKAQEELLKLLDKEALKHKKDEGAAPGKNKARRKKRKKEKEKKTAKPEVNQSASEEEKAALTKQKSQPEENKSASEEEKSALTKQKSQPEENKSASEEEKSALMKKKSQPEVNHSASEEEKAALTKQKANPEENKSASEKDTEDAEYLLQLKADVEKISGITEGNAFLKGTRLLKILIKKTFGKDSSIYKQWLDVNIHSLTDTDISVEMDSLDRKNATTRPTLSPNSDTIKTVSLPTRPCAPDGSPFDITLVVKGRINPPTPTGFCQFQFALAGTEEELDKYLSEITQGSVTPKEHILDLLLNPISDTQELHPEKTMPLFSNFLRRTFKVHLRTLLFRHAINHTQSDSLPSYRLKEGSETHDPDKPAQEESKRHSMCMARGGGVKNASKQSPDSDPKGSLAGGDTDFTEIKAIHAASQELRELFGSEEKNTTRLIRNNQLCEFYHSLPIKLDGACLVSGHQFTTQLVSALTLQQLSTLTTGTSEPTLLKQLHEIMGHDREARRSLNTIIHDQLKNLLKVEQSQDTFIKLTSVKKQWRAFEYHSELLMQLDKLKTLFKHNPPNSKAITSQLRLLTQMTGSLNQHALLPEGACQIQKAATAIAPKGSNTSLDAFRQILNKKLDAMEPAPKKASASPSLPSKCKASTFSIPTRKQPGSEASKASVVDPANPQGAATGTVA